MKIRARWLDGPLNSSLFRQRTFWLDSVSHFFANNNNNNPNDDFGMRSWSFLDALIHPMVLFLFLSQFFLISLHFEWAGKWRRRNQRMNGKIPSKLLQLLSRSFRLETLLFCSAHLAQFLPVRLSLNSFGEENKNKDTIRDMCTSIYIFTAAHFGSVAI